jgi:hypothetical protein
LNIYGLKVNRMHETYSRIKKTVGSEIKDRGRVLMGTGVTPAGLKNNRRAFFIL